MGNSYYTEKEFFFETKKKLNTTIQFNKHDSLESISNVSIKNIGEKTFRNS